MKILVGAILACYIAIPAQGQAAICSGPPLSGRLLNQIIYTAKTESQLLDVACYSQRKSAHFEQVAAKKSKNLEWAYAHNIGGPKSPNDLKRVLRAAMSIHIPARNYNSICRESSGT